MLASRIHSKSNNWEHVTGVWDGEKKIPYALKARCCKCGKEETIPMPGGLSYTCPQPYADKVWTKKGWHVANKRTRDVCPECIAKEVEERMNKRVSTTGRPITPVREKLAEIKITQQQDTLSSEIQTILNEWDKDRPTVVAVEPPRKPTHDERRIIHNKLEDVYLDAKRGYDTEWTDERVAKDLGVPRAWVAEVREFAFGPEKVVDPELVKLLEDAKRVEASIVKRLDEFDAMRTALHVDLSGLRARIDAYEAKIKNFL